MKADLEALHCGPGARSAGQQRAGLLMAAAGAASVRFAGVPGGGHAALDAGGRPEAAPPDVQPQERLSWRPAGAPAFLWYAAADRPSQLHTSV